ncbi:MAG: riboflavin biosynthesis protein RibF [Clostridia bacterium]|nr:riboflavin biosynthesis protein RibF [Clostridia bacterium]
MECITYCPGRVSAARPSVVALGFFDGVHLGHRALLRLAREKADGLGLPLSVFTFPAEDENIKRSAHRLYDTEKKLSLLASLGVDIVYMCELSAVSDIAAEDFAKKSLAEELLAAVSVCGFNYRFGRGAAGDADALCRYMKEIGRENLVLAPLYDGGELLSSRAVRAYLKNGDVERASALLGAPYTLSGAVEGGDGRGRSLGFPTVNFPLEKNRLLLPSGVYATAVRTAEGKFASVTNLGTCPTFGERVLHAETHICDFTGDLYGETVEVEFLKRLRDEKAFPSKDALTVQINIDKKEAMEVYKAWQEAGQN